MTDENLQGLYQVQKTITFELKNIWTNGNDDQDKVEFEKTQDWVDSLFNLSAKDFDEKEKISKVLDLSDKITSFAENFGNLIVKKYFDWNAVFVSKYFVENVDRNLFHQKKKKPILQVKKINPQNKNEYKQDYKFSSNNTIFVTNLVFNDEGQQIQHYLETLSDRVRFWKEKVQKDFDIKFGNSQHSFSGKSYYYGNIRALVENVQKLIQVISFFSPSNYELREKIKETQKVLTDLEDIQKLTGESKQLLEEVRDFANDNTKKEVELTTLNHRAVNKDPKKIEEQNKEVKNLEDEMEKLKREISALDEEEKEIVKKLESVLIQNLPELDLLNSTTEDGKYVLELYQIKSNGEKLNGDEEKWIKEHKFQKTVSKYLKMEGVLVTEKSQVQNYRQSGEKLKNKNQLNKVENLDEYKNSQEFKEKWKQYSDFKKEKRDKSVALGNKKSLYNSISREILRQQMCNHFSVLIKDEDEQNPYFYLALIPNKNKEEMNKIFEEIKNSTGKWSFLDFNRLTFKALEKLALLESSTFEVSNPEMTKEAKNIWKDYKEKSFNDYKNNRLLQNLKGYQRNQKKQELEKQSLNKIINFCIRCIKNLPETENLNFTFKKPEEYETLEEFADYVDKLGYYSEWKNVDKDKIYELEKSGKIKVFKLHNKDFRKVKKGGSEHKPNLFTLYWLDAMNLDKANIRLLPEIDIYKRSKETDLEKSNREVICKADGEKKKEILAKNRIFENKIYASFRLEFYPESERLDFESVNERISENFKGNDVYYLGLDRGENELVSWCLIDSNRRLIKNGDWTSFKGVNYADKLKQFYKSDKEKVSIQELILQAQGAIGEEKNQELKKEKIEEFKKLESELKNRNLLAQEFVKKGYCGCLINEINQILIEYPNTFIVLEDLAKCNFRQKNLLKTLGATVYQEIENALVNKFKYRTVKGAEIQGLQTVPDIVKIEDLRKADEVKEGDNIGKTKVVKSKDKVGNILFVDPMNTSQECPSCGFYKDNYKDHDYFFNKKDNCYILKLTWNDKEGVDFTIDEDFTSYEYSEGDKDIKETKIYPILESEDEFNALEKIYITRNHPSLNEDFIRCPFCGFDTRKNKEIEDNKRQELEKITSGDLSAAYNIAKRGLALITNNN